MIRSEKMTIKTQEALGAAQQLAASDQNGSIEPEHLLLALLDQEGGLVGSILQKIGANPQYVRSKVEKELEEASPGNRPGCRCIFLRRCIMPWIPPSGRPMP